MHAASVPPMQAGPLPLNFDGVQADTPAMEALGTWLSARLKEERTATEILHSRLLSELEQRLIAFGPCSSAAAETDTPATSTSCALQARCTSSRQKRLASSTTNHQEAVLAAVPRFAPVAMHSAAPVDEDKAEPVTDGAAGLFDSETREHSKESVEITPQRSVIQTFGDMLRISSASPRNSEVSEGMNNKTSLRSSGIRASVGLALSGIRPSVMNQSISQLFKYGLDGEQEPEGYVSRMVASAHFDTAMSVVIFINVIVIALETEYRGLGISSELRTDTVGPDTVHSPNWPAADEVFGMLEWIFGLFFWGELLLRVSCERFAMFKSYIAWIDLLVAVSWTIGKIGSLGGFNPTLLRVLRVMRAVRMVKLLRFVESFDSLQLMITACVASMTALMWFTVILTFVLTFCALLTTEMLHLYYFPQLPGPGSDLDPKAWDMYLAFGTFTRSLFSMYELALANWPPLARLLSEEVTQWFMLLTVGHKLVIGFAMLGVINGIFMQETLSCVALDDDIMVRQKQRQSQALKEKLKRLFKLADADGSGHVTLSEFLTVLNLKQVRTWLCSMGFDSNDVESAFWMLAGDDGKITEQELIEGVEHLRGPARSIDVVTILTRGTIGKNALKVLEEVRKTEVPGGGRMSTLHAVGSRTFMSTDSTGSRTRSSDQGQLEAKRRTHFSESVRKSADGSDSDVLAGDQLMIGGIGTVLEEPGDTAQSDGNGLLAPQTSEGDDIQENTILHM